MARGTVRTHTRRTKTGSTTTVKRHDRKTQGSGIVSPGHSWHLFKRAFQAARRRKRATAVLLGGLALGELGAWATLRGTGLMLVTAGFLATAVATIALSASGASR